MSLKTVLVGGAAAALLSTMAFATTASAQPDTYICNDQTCYDDQADETRRLNLEQLENGGTVMMQDQYDDDSDMQGQGGPLFENEEDANRSMNSDGGYADDDAYSDDDADMAPPADDYDDEDEY